MFLAFFFLALAAVLFALLPRVRNNASLPREPLAFMRQARQPPRPLEQIFQPEERRSETAPRTEEAQPAEAQPRGGVETPQTTAEQDPYVAPDGQAGEEPRPAETRERGLFFVQTEGDGSELRLARVSRTLAASDSPLADSLNALLSGPTAEEAGRGLLSFIPPDTRILSVRVQGSAGRNTAYINFSECFQYNTRGSEGLASQIRQVVWTATEFPNVHDVQILIEGNRVDLLHGGIRIGSPIER